MSLRADVTSIVHTKESCEEESQVEYKNKNNKKNENKRRRTKKRKKEKENGRFLGLPSMGVEYITGPRESLEIKELKDNWVTANRYTPLRMKTVKKGRERWYY